MSLRQYEYFLAAAEECNITRAAEKLFLSQQALSEQISRLENEYGVKFFRRGRKMELTYEGSCMMQTAREILNLDRSLRLQFEDLSSNLHGEVSFGISFSRARSFFPLVLNRFYKKYPQVSINLFSGNSDQLRNGLLNGSLDLVMSYNYHSKTEVTCIPLGKERLFALVPCSLCPAVAGDDWQQKLSALEEGISIKALSRAPLITVNEQNYIYWILQSLFHKHQLSPNIIFESNDLDMLSNLAKGGMGVAFLPELLVASRPELIHPDGERTLYAFPLDDRSSDMSVVVAYKKSRYLSVLSQALIRELQEAYGDMTSSLEK
ncbi:MAG: LysR family transcriptional regulator [Oscillospiraceae bacterium]|nr:LysR family transcriptional regulator [Oscillospiraceae bacterium]